MSFLSFFPTSLIVSRYLDAGYEVSDVVFETRFPMVLPALEPAVKRWIAYEEEYVKRGFQPLSSDQFLAYDECAVRRPHNDAPVYHAKIFEKYFSDFNGCLQECSSGWGYIRPSTELMQQLEDALMK